MNRRQDCQRRRPLPGPVSPTVILCGTKRKWSTRQSSSSVVMPRILHVPDRPDTECIGWRDKTSYLLKACLLRRRYSHAPCSDYLVSSRLVEVDCRKKFSVHANPCKQTVVVFTFALSTYTGSNQIRVTAHNVGNAQRWNSLDCFVNANSMTFFALSTCLALHFMGHVERLRRGRETARHGRQHGVTGRIC